MAKFIVSVDRETPARAGAIGMYQIVTLERVDENGDLKEDVSGDIDLGLHFSESDTNDLKEYLSSIFAIPKNKINLEFV